MKLVPELFTGYTTNPYYLRSVCKGQKQCSVQAVSVLHLLSCSLPAEINLLPFRARERPDCCCLNFCLTDGSRVVVSTDRLGAVAAQCREVMTAARYERPQAKSQSVSPASYGCSPTPFVSE